MSATTHTEFEGQCMRARLASTYSLARPVLVCICHTPGSPARFVVQGHMVSDYVWFLQREKGSRFRALRAYHQGREVPVPTDHRRGY